MSSYCSANLYDIGNWYSAFPQWTAVFDIFVHKNSGTSGVAKKDRKGIVYSAISVNLLDKKVVALLGTARFS